MALAAFLHEGILLSRWCDQEIGFVFGRRKVLLPLMFDEAPHGFLGKYQGLRCTGRTPRAIADLVVETLLARKETRQAMIDCQLRAFVDAMSFENANGISDRLGAPCPTRLDRATPRTRSSGAGEAPGVRRPRR